MNHAPTNLAKLFERAADHLSTVGLHQGNFYDVKQRAEQRTPVDECRVCAIGALNFAIAGHPCPREMSAENDETVSQAMRIAHSHLGGGLMAYSEATGRTTEEVVTLLRTLARTTSTGEPRPSFAR